MFDQIITVYHKHRGEDGETWERSVIEGVHYVETHGEAIRKHGVQGLYRLQVIIPVAGRVNLHIDPGDTIVLGKSETEIIRSTRELPRGYTVISSDRKVLDSDMSHLEVMAQ